MTVMNNYTIKFYDGFALVREVTTIAENGKKALSIALKEVEGLAYFNKVKIIYLGSS